MGDNVPPPEREWGVLVNWSGRVFVEGVLSSGELSLEKYCRFARRTSWVQRSSGVETNSLDANLVQQLAGLAHDPLFRIFLGVRKAYYSLDRWLCLNILRGYDWVQNWSGYSITSGSGRVFSQRQVSA